MKINTKIIKGLNPCKDRLDNYLKYYETADFDVRSFLGLENITHKDKLWVVLRLIPNETKVIFALDCSFSAADAYAAADACAAAADACACAAAADACAAAADVAACAAYAAAAADVAACAAAAYADVAAYARKTEESRQIEALIYLIGGDK